MPRFLWTVNLSTRLDEPLIFTAYIVDNYCRLLNIDSTILRTGYAPDGCRVLDVLDMPL